MDAHSKAVMILGEIAVGAGLLATFYGAYKAIMFIVNIWLRLHL